MPRSGDSRYLNLLTGRKSAFLPQGRFVAPIHVKSGTAKGHIGPVGRAKFHANRPQNGKNFHFLVETRLERANPLTDLYNYQGLLYAQLSCISISHLTRFASQGTELLLSNRASVIYPEFFRAPCRKNYALDRKMIGTFLMVSTSHIPVQSLGKVELGAPAVGAKMWCLFFFFSVTLRVRHALCQRGTQFEQLLCRRLRVDFDSVFFFSEWIAVSDAVDSSHFFVARWRHNCREIAVKNCEKSKNRRKSLCEPLRIDNRNILIKFHRNGLEPRTQMCTYTEYFRTSLHSANSKCQTSCGQSKNGSKRTSVYAPKVIQKVNFPR